jgi:hypothetical protein
MQGVAVILQISEWGKNPQAQVWYNLKAADLLLVHDFDKKKLNCDHAEV